MANDARLPILDGARGGPPVDKVSVSAALVGLSDLAADVGDLIAELDVNPFAVSADGCLALDALVVPTALAETLSQPIRQIQEEP